MIHHLFPNFIDVVLSVGMAQSHIQNFNVSIFVYFFLEQVA